MRPVRARLAAVLCSMAALTITVVSAGAEVQPRLQPKPFGTTADGTQVVYYVLKNKNGVEAKVTNYGATLISLNVPDRSGKFADVVLGYDNLNEYENGHASFGATVGRYANRIAHAEFKLNGTIYKLAKNNGDNSIHGGKRNFTRVVWQSEDASRDGVSAVKFTYLSKNGEEGFPGNLTTTVVYSLDDDNELKIDYDLISDKDTVYNLTNHTYFNLAGIGSGDVLNHRLMVNADRFTPVDSALIPTGELKNVAGTPFDFRKATAIGVRIDRDDEQLKLGAGYDHNFVINGKAGVLRKAAEVFEPSTGRVLLVSTTEPGVQLYTANHLDGTEHGKGVPAYPKRSALCLETQHFPDSPNHPAFPSTMLKAGQHYRSATIYKFSTR